MFTHIDEKNQPRMVDVTDKKVTERMAHAQCSVEVPPEVWSKFSSGEIQSKKGPVFQTGIIAGTFAVKKTSDLIPFCHPIPVEGCDIKVQMGANHLIIIDCFVRCTGKTGVEMEALTGASVTALTIYDMCKSISHNIHIRDLFLVEKKGGKSDIGPGKSEVTPLYGLVMAGGRSQRMQKDKSAIEYFEKPQAEYVYRLLEKFCEKTFISCRLEQSQDNHLRNFPQIHDQYPDGGPLGAIKTAMEKFPNASWLVLACDLPFFQEEAIRNLLSSREVNMQATAYWNGERSWPEPLCAIYEKTIYPIISESFLQGKSCPGKVLVNPQVMVKKVLVDDPLFLQMLTNINTAEEFKHAQKEISHAHKSHLFCRSERKSGSIGGDHSHSSENTSRTL